MALFLQQRGISDLSAARLPVLKAAVVPAHKETNTEVKTISPNVWVHWTLDDFLSRAVGANKMMYYSTDGMNWLHGDGAGFRCFLEHLAEGRLVEGCKSTKSTATAHLWLWPKMLSPPATPGRVPIQSPGVYPQSHDAMGSD